MKDYDYTSLPIQFHKEEAEVSIQFIPKDSSSGLQIEYLLPIKFPQKKYYWYVGSSMYYSNLSDRRVSIQKIQVNDLTQSFKLSEEEPLDGEIGIAAILRGGRLIGNSGLGLHAAAGTGFSIGKEVKPRFMKGCGVSFGQKHSFVIDYGVIVGHVDQIGKNIELGVELNEEPQQLIKQLKWKKIVSLGYAYRL